MPTSIMVEIMYLDAKSGNSAQINKKAINQILTNQV
jgi:hypothetical protein